MGRFYMGKVVVFILFGFANLLVFSVKGQVIWEEDFSGYSNLATVGMNKNTANPAVDWTSTAQDCDGGGAQNDTRTTWSGSDYWGIFNGEFRCNDVEGLTCCGSGTQRGGSTDNEFITEFIDISTYCNVRISLSARETGSHEAFSPGCDNSSDRLYSYYRIDGGAWQLFENNGALSDDWTSATITQDNLNGNTLQIRFLAGAKANSENIYWDNIRVENGTGCCEELSDLTITGNTLLCAPPATQTYSASVTSGSGPIAYTWSLPDGGGTFAGGNTGASVSVDWTGTGTYRLQVNASNECSNEVTTVNITINEPPSVSINPNPAEICEGEDVTLTASGAGSYSWDNGLGAGASKTVSPNANTTYTVTGSVAGCPDDQESVDVTVNPAPDFTLSADPSTAICEGEDVELEASDSQTLFDAYDYEWTDDATAGNPRIVSPATTTTYTITATDNSGCEQSESITIQVNENPTPDLGADVAVCADATPVTLDAGSYTSYSWSPNGETSQTIDVSTSGTYTVTVTDANGCQGSDAVDVTVNPLPTVNIAADDAALCEGETTELTASGAGSYVWEDGSTANPRTVAPTSTTTYSVTGTDANGCENTEDITITVNPLPTPDLGADVVVCADATPITLDAGSYASYSWSPNSETSQTIDVSTSGTYTVTVTDANGCQGSDAVDVTVNPLPTVNIAADDAALCEGETTELTASGADSYVWEDGSTANSRAVAPSSTTTYSVTGTDANGCENTDDITITVNPLPTPDLGDDVEVCADATPVTLDAGSYASYNWSPNGETSQTIDVSTSGTYTVTVTDANGCQGSDAVDVTVNPLPAVSIAADDAALCEGETTELTASGADSYVWEDGSTANPRTVAPTSTSTYSVTGTDANGCENTDDITITVNPLPTVTINQTPNPVCEGEDATLQVTLSSGASFTWDDDNSNTNPRTIINPTNNQSFSVTAVNGNGCENTASIAIQVTPVPAAPADQNVSYCLNDFASQLTPNGNNFQWFDAGMNLLPEAPTPNTSTAGTTTYYVREVDPSGNCASPEATVTVTVNNAQGISIAPNKEPLCDGENVTLTVSFASGSFTWDDDNTSTNRRTIIQPSDGETYTATLNDANACANSDTYTIRVNPLPTVGIAANDESICEGETATLTASGANSYEWEDGSTINPRTVAPTSTTTYSVTGTDANGCENTDNITITVNPLPNVSAVALPATLCLGESSSLSASGADSYVWEDGITTNPREVSPTSTTTYSVTGTDANGCENTDDITVTVNPLPTVSIAADDADLCEGETTTLTANGADSYVWEDGSTTNPRAVLPTSTTTYSVTGTGANGCENTADILITVNPLPAVSIAADDADLCEGESTQLTASGADSYVWEDGSTSNPRTVSPTSTTTYSVTATDANGCENTDAITVTVNPLPAVSIATDDAELCEGETTTLTASGADSYQWENGSTINPRTVSPTSTTTYSVTGTDANGCEHTDDITITVNPLPNVSAIALPATLCVGESSSLNASGANSYQWEDGSTSNPRTVSPASTTTYSVIGTDANGCENTDDITVTVNPLPTVSIAADDADLCEGESTELTANGADAYVWEDGSTANPRAVSPTNTTTYSVTGTDANGCRNSDDITVTVNPLPTVSIFANDESICEGETATLTASGANAYVWEDGSTTNPREVSPTSTTTYSVRGTDANGCKNTADISVTVNPLPTVSIAAEDGEVCVGESTQLTASGADTYEWEDGSAANPRTILPTSTTTYSVTGTDANGCENTSEITIIVNPLPNVSVTANPTAVCEGESSTLQATGAAGYVWEDNNSTNNPRTVTPSNTTIYTVTGTDGNGCSAQASVSVNVKPVPPKPQEQSDFFCQFDRIGRLQPNTADYVWYDENIDPLPEAPKPDSSVVGSVQYFFQQENNGCFSPLARYEVTIKPKPNAFLAQSRIDCQFDTPAQLEPSGSDFVWYDSNGNALANAPTPNTDVAGVRQFTFRRELDGCFSDATDFTYTVNPKPAKPQEQTIDYCFEASASQLQPNTANYQWYDANQNDLSQAPTPNTTNEGEQQFFYSETANGCESDLAGVVVRVADEIPPFDGYTTRYCQFETPEAIDPGQGTPNWFDENGNALGSENPIPTTDVPGVTRYFATKEFAGCTSEESAFMVEVIARPNTPATGTDTLFYCQQDAASPLTPRLGNHNWYNESGTYLGNSYTPSTGAVDTSTFYVSVTENGCESLSDSVVVVVKEKPQAPVASNTGPYCQEDVATPLQPNGVGYTWFLFDNGSNQYIHQGNTATPATDISGSLQYQVTLTENGCTSDATLVSVSIKPKPMAPQVANLRYCVGESAAPLTATAAAGNTLRWYNVNKQALPNTPTPSTTEADTLHYFAAQTQNGCQSDFSDTLQVVVNALPTINASVQSACPGDAFEIDVTCTGQPNFDFEVVNTSNQNTTNYSASSTETTVSLNVPNGSYKLRLKADAFCNAAQEGVVTLSLNRFEAPQATLSLNEDPCLQETYVVAIFTGDPNFSFIWDVPGATQQTRTIGETSDSILVSQPGVVRLLNVSDAHCQANSNPQINVSKTDYNTPSLMAMDTEVCEGSALSFTVSNLEPGMETVVWLDGQEYVLTQSDIITLPNAAPGCYSAQVFATDIARGCSTDTLTWEDLFCVQENPISDFELQPEVSFQEATNRIVENTSMGGTDFTWFVAGEAVSDSYNLVYDFTEFQGDTAIVCLEAILQPNNALVCADTLCKPITTATGAPIYIPNAFTPDANVLNETWGPETDGKFDFYELQVFDRWGQVVFESQSASERWDGYLEGALVQPGIYAYVLKYRYVNEIGEHRMHGDVKVLR